MAAPAVDHHRAPDWLTKDYVQDKLRAYFKDEQLQLQQLDIKPATTKGENYASIMTRINVEYQRKGANRSETASFLLKSSFEDHSAAANILEPYGIYTREMDMYEFVLPKLTLLLQELGGKRKLFASTVHVDRAHGAIMFEDLSLQQYVAPSRLKGLDAQHTEMTLEQLAKFHAATAVLNQREPGIFSSNFDRGMFNRHTRGYTPIMQELLRALVRSIEKDEALRKRYKHKLQGLLEHIMEYGERASDVNEGDFLTLAHGDFWLLNTMFQYDAASGLPSNVVLIDFQFSIWNSPTLDLHYLFNTSLPEHERLHSQTQLVQFYYYKLVEALRQLKYGGPVPSLFNFQRQFEARAFHGLFAGLVFQPVMLYDGKEQGSMEIVLSHTESAMRFKDDVYQCEPMQQRLRNLLPMLDHKGLLDDMDLSSIIVDNA